MHRRATVLLLAAVALACTWVWWLPAGRTDPAPATQPAPQVPPTSSAERTRQALDQVIDLEFADHSLEQVVDTLRMRTGLKFFLDTTVLPALRTRLGDLSINPAGLLPVAENPGEKKAVKLAPGLKCKLRQVKLRTALHVLLRHYDLDYAILGDTVLISTADETKRRQLQQPVDVNVQKVPLAQALQELSRRTATEIVLDRVAAQPGQSQASVTLRVTDVPLARAVSLLAAAAELWVVPVDKVLFVTTEKRATALQVESETKKTADMLKGTELLLGLKWPLSMMQPVATPIFGPCNPTGMFSLPAPKEDPGPAPLCCEEAAPVGLQGGKSGPAKKPEGAGQPPAPKPSAAVQILQKLAEPMDVKEEILTTPHSLPKVLGHLTERYDFPALLLDRNAFRNENPDAPDLKETQVQLPPLKGVPRAKILQMLLEQVPTGNATYLVRRGYLLVTTYEGAAPDRQAVHAVFVQRPLEEALQELSDQTGISVVLDGRVAAKGRLPVTATFRTGTNLFNAVRLLADMADLKAVAVDNTLYVTLRSNSTEFPPVGIPGKRRTDGAAQ